jgi:thiamine-monophosphate kinase
MIDVSDGLVQDLGHICRASGTGAVIHNQRLPLSAGYSALAGKDGTRHALMGGEDYELLFCARRSNRGRIQKLSESVRVPISHIGTCVARKGVIVLDEMGKAISAGALSGHDHFKNA